MTSDPTPTRTGRCLCGDVTYELAGEPIATAVCHCERQSGGAFSVNIVVHTTQFNVSGTSQTYDETDEGGTVVYVHRRFCGTCGSPIVSELAQTDGVVAVKAGTLDDRSTLQPNVEVWCIDRQPWVTLPNMAVSLEREQLEGGQPLSPQRRRQVGRPPHRSGDSEAVAR